MKRTHSIRIPVTLAEMREAKQFAKRLDRPLTTLLREMLRDAAGKSLAAPPQAARKPSP
jgi:hypothetical protein